MKTFLIPIPKHLHQKQGEQKDVSFELSHHNYFINGDKFASPLRQHITPYFKGYLHEVMKYSVQVTLFYETDVLKSV